MEFISQRYKVALTFENQPIQLILIDKVKPYGHLNKYIKKR